MKRFKLGARVLVKAVGDNTILPLTPPVLGTVVRLRHCDIGAWVNLDHRVYDACHPFPVDDESGRGAHVLAYPEDCEAV